MGVSGKWLWSECGVYIFILFILYTAKELDLKEGGWGSALILIGDKYRTKIEIAMVSN